MWLLLGFAVHHVYSAVLMATVEKNGTMDSIFSGYKLVPPRRPRVLGPYRWHHTARDDAMSKPTPLLVLGLGNVLLERRRRRRRRPWRSCSIATELPDGRAGARRRHARPVAAAISRGRRRRHPRRRHQGRRAAWQPRPPGRRRGGAGRRHAAVAASDRRGRPARWRALARPLPARGSCCSASCPRSMELAVGLSPRVRDALPELVERVVDEARRDWASCSFASHARTPMKTPAAGGAVDVARLAGAARDVDRDLPRPYRSLEVPATLLDSSEAQAPRAARCFSSTARSVTASAATVMVSRREGLDAATARLHRSGLAPVDVAAPRVLRDSRRASRGRRCRRGRTSASRMPGI